MTTGRGMLHRLGRDQRGAIAVVFVLLFPVVVAAVGLGVETGIWYTLKRHYQSVADVVAYSGALEIVGGGSTKCQTDWPNCIAAKNVAITNGFNPDDPAKAASTLDVADVGGATTVTATLRHQQAPLLVSYFLGTTPFTILNKAVAQIQKISACLSGLGEGTTLQLTGSASITMPGCTVTSTSTDVDSIKTIGEGAAELNAYTIVTAGGVNGSCGNITGLDVPPSCNNDPPPCDPYNDTAGLCGGNVVNAPAMPTTMPATVTTFPTLPDFPGAPTAQSVTTPATPGSQSLPGGCSLSPTVSDPPATCYASPTGVTISTTVNFAASTSYYFVGGVTINSGGTANLGDRAALFLASGNFRVNSDGTVNFAAVTSGSTSIYAATGNLVSDSGSTINFTGGGSSAYSFKIATGGSYALSGNTFFGNANYAFRSVTGSGVNLALNGCTVFTPGTATLRVVDGNLTTGTGGVYFNPNGSACGSIYTSAASTYALQVQNGGSYTFGSGGSDPVAFGPAAYDFKVGSVTVNGTATFQPGTSTLTTALKMASGFTTASGSTLTFCGASTIGSCSNSANTSYALSATSYTLGGTVTFGSSSGSSGGTNFGYGFYGGAMTIASTANAGFLAPVNFYLDSGSLAVAGCAAFEGGTSTINIHSGSLTEGSTGSMTFNPSGTACGVSYTSATSQYNIETVGNGNGVTFGGSAALNSGTYYFMNSANSGGNGVSITGGSVGSPVTLGGGIYSVERGSFSITGTGHASFEAGTLCAPSATTAPPTGTCIYMKNGGFSNAGTATFGAGTIYFWNESGGFANTSTGALTFTGGDDGDGNPSSYYFFNPDPSGSSSATTGLSVDGTAAFGPATYYIVNGNLVIGSGATVTCPGCAVGGAGDTFVLTGTGTGTTLEDNIGTVAISSPTATLNAPTTGDYAGLLIFQDRNASGDYSFTGVSSNCQSGNCNILEGDDATDLTGAIYLATGGLGFQGGKSIGNCLVLFAAEIRITGAASLTSDGCAAAGVDTITTNRAVLTQ